MHTFCKFFFSNFYHNLKNKSSIFYNFITSSSELKNLKDKFLTILQRFYESKGHQKKQIQVGG
jgi:hypothetical protein